MPCKYDILLCNSCIAHILIVQTNVIFCDESGVWFYQNSKIISQDVGVVKVYIIEKIWYLKAYVKNGAEIMEGNFRLLSDKELKNAEKIMNFN